MGAKQTFEDKIRGQIETVGSHVANLEKVATKKKNEQVIESLSDLGICVDSLASAIDENRLSTSPILVLTELEKATRDVAAAIANAASNIADHGGNFTNQVNLLHRKVWANGLIDPAAEVRAQKIAAGQLDAEMTVARDTIAELKKGLELRDQLGAAVSALADFMERAENATAASEKHKAQLEGDMVKCCGSGHDQAAIFLTPSANSTPAITSATSAEPFNARHLFDAFSISLNTIVKHATREPDPFVLR